MFNIPNQADAAFPAQAQVDSGDFSILALAQEGTGVVHGCAVTAQGSPNMTVAVAAGAVTVDNVTPVDVTAGNVTIAAANATNPRIDLIYAGSDGTKGVITGTPAANPVYPAISSTQVILAAVYVPAGDTAINANQIVDKRAKPAEPSSRVHTNTLATDYIQSEPLTMTVLSGTFVPDSSEVEVEVDTQASNWGFAWTTMRFLCGLTSLGSFQQAGHYLPIKAGVSNETIGTVGQESQGHVYKRFKLTGLTPGSSYTYRLQTSITGALYQQHITPAFQPFNVVIVDPPDPVQDSIHKAYIRLYGTGGIMVMNPIPATKWATLNARAVTPEDSATYMITGLGAADGGQCGTPGEKTYEVTINGAPTGGTWTLTYQDPSGGFGVTSTLSTSASAAQVQTALENLASLVPGDVVVTGTAPTYTIRITGQLAGVGGTDMFADNTFTGGTNPWVRVNVVRLAGESPYVVFSEYWGNKVHVVNTETDTSTAYTLATPWACAAKSDTLVYVGSAGNLYPMTLPAGTFGSPISINGGVSALVLDLKIDIPNNIAFAALDTASNNLKRIALTGGTVTHTVSPVSKPTALALSVDNTKLFVGCLDGRVEVRNASDLSLITTMTQVDQNSRVNTLVVGPRGRSLYVTTDTGWWHYWYIGPDGEGGPQYGWFDGLQVAQDGAVPASVAVTSSENIWAVSRTGRIYIWPGSEFTIRPSWLSFLNEYATVKVRGVR